MIDENQSPVGVPDLRSEKQKRRANGELRTKGQGLERKSLGWADEILDLAAGVLIFIVVGMAGAIVLGKGSPAGWLLVVPGAAFIWWRVAAFKTREWRAGR